MNRQSGLLFGLCLSLVVVLGVAAYAAAPRFTEVQAQSAARPAAAPQDVDPFAAIGGAGDARRPSYQGGSPSGGETMVPGPADAVSVIILLEGDSVSAYKHHIRTSSQGLIEADQERVRAYDLSVRERQRRLLQRIAAEGITLQVRRRYQYLLNGIAGSTKMADMERIAAMAGVRGVYPDHEVCAVLEDSVPLIGADQVWTMLGPGGQLVTGQGMRIAVIDSGIDYTHPDLGAGFGPGHKVIDGYDFVNDDDDPMDDNGHGTHVAGIVAAKGVLRGVAPDASLYAFKALDEEGRGPSSDIIAAMERATNPDGDPTTDDAVDVINLSLGGEGNPDDPMARAVDAAVDQGVAVVVSAGNTG